MSNYGDPAVPDHIPPSSTAIAPSGRPPKEIVPRMPDGVAPRGAKRSGSTKVQRRENRRKAMEMALAGASYQQIADACGWKSKGTAYKNVQAALRDWSPIDPAQVETLRQAELAKLDRLQQSQWTNALKGDLRAGEFVLKVHERRARLLGLDNPVRSEVKVTAELDGEIEALLALLPPPDKG